jgi:hypothetical protein
MLNSTRAERLSLCAFALRTRRLYHREFLGDEIPNVLRTEFGELNVAD